MPLIVIHQVRTTKGAPPEPVGAWQVQGMTAIPYYSPSHLKYLKRGEKALHERPPMALEEWVQFLAATKANWRVHGDSLSDVDLDQVLDHEQRAFREHTRLLQLKKAEGDATGPTDQHEAAAEASLVGTRAAYAQSWWIASELVRRHPRLMAYEMYPGGGQYDVLCVTEPASLSGQPGSRHVPRVMLNRSGRIQIRHETHDMVVATWSRVLGSRTPHSTIKTIERLTGWVAAKPTPATTRRALAYRLFASLLTLTLNDRHGWDVRNEFCDTSGETPFTMGYLASFPKAIEALRDTPSLGVPAEPESHFWALRRGKKTIAIVSMEGSAFFADGTVVDLMAEYDTHNRRITPMTVALLRKWL